MKKSTAIIPAWSHARVQNIFEYTVSPSRFELIPGDEGINRGETQTRNSRSRREDRLRVCHRIAGPRVYTQSSIDAPDIFARTVVEIDIDRETYEA